MLKQEVVGNKPWRNSGAPHQFFLFPTPVSVGEQSPSNSKSFRGKQIRFGGGTAVAAILRVSIQKNPCGLNKEPLVGILPTNALGRLTE